MPAGNAAGKTKRRFRLSCVCGVWCCADFVSFFSHFLRRVPQARRGAFSFGVVCSSFSRVWYVFRRKTYLKRSGRPIHKDERAHHHASRSLVGKVLESAFCLYPWRLRHSSAYLHPDYIETEN